jgi:hypothetical protein
MMTRNLSAADMEDAPAFLDEAAVGHLRHQRVREGVGERGGQARLVEEFNGLQVCEAPVELALGHLGDRLQEGTRHLFADGCSALQQVLLRGWQSVDAGGEDGLHGDWHLQAREGLGETVGPPLADQDLRLHQGLHALLKDEPQRDARGRSAAEALARVPGPSSDGLISNDNHKIRP